MLEVLSNYCLATKPLTNDQGQGQPKGQDKGEGQAYGLQTNASASRVPDGPSGNSELDSDQSGTSSPANSQSEQCPPINSQLQSSVYDFSNQSQTADTVSKLIVLKYLELLRRKEQQASELIRLSYLVVRVTAAKAKKVNCRLNGSVMFEKFILRSTSSQSATAHQSRGCAYNQSHVHISNYMAAAVFDKRAISIVAKYMKFLKRKEIAAYKVVRNFLPIFKLLQSEKNYVNCNRTVTSLLDHHLL